MLVLLKAHNVDFSAMKIIFAAIMGFITKNILLKNDKIKDRKENLRKVKIGRIEKTEMQRKENEYHRKKM